MISFSNPPPVVTGLLDFQGSTDASANPNYPAASKGDSYVISVAGKVGGASGKTVAVGDFLVAIADNAGGTEASVGTSWVVIQANITTLDRPEFANVQITASTLTYGASVVLDFDGNGFQTVTLTGVIEFTTSNLAAGRSKTIRVVGDSSNRAFTFPAGWKFMGAAAPTESTANKVGMLTLTSFGTTDANVVAAWSEEP